MDLYVIMWCYMALDTVFMSFLLHLLCRILLAFVKMVPMEKGEENNALPCTNSNNWPTACKIQISGFQISKFITLIY